MRSCVKGRSKTYTKVQDFIALEEAVPDQKAVKALAAQQQIKAEIFSWFLN